MNNFVIIDPCYLKDNEKWWSDYSKALFINGGKKEQDKKLIKFGNFEGVVVLNPEGDISWGDYNLIIKNIEPIIIPSCDSGNHVIFRLEDVYKYLDDYKFFTIFQAELELKDLVNNFVVLSLF